MSSTAGSSATSTTTNLFPTTTASGATNNNNNNVYGTNPTIYYFVFLGVLLLLMSAGGGLAFRAYRMRRRYRQQRREALARGDPMLPGQTDYWGLANFFAMDPDQLREAADRAAASAGGGGKRGRWERLPSMWEGEVEDGMDDEKVRAERNELDEMQPVALQSLLPLPSNTAPLLDHELPPSAYGAQGSGRTTPSRRQPMRDMFTTTRQRQQAADAAEAEASRRGGRSRHREERNKEADRAIEVGEPIRLAVVVRMPRDPRDVQQERERARESLLDDEEERTGWEQGMAIGVWEGEVGPNERR